MFWIYVIIVISLVPSLLLLAKSKKVVPVTLSCRKPKDGKEMRTTNNNKSNIFFEEWDTMFCDVSHSLDYAVVKIVTDCPILVKQEQVHAIKHKQAQVELREQGVQRFWIIDRILDLVCLRMGTTMSIAVMGAIETIFSHGLYLATISPFAPSDWESDLLLWHAFEEAEHNVLTVQSLKKKISFFLRVMTLPLVLILSATFFFFGPIFTILSSSQIVNNHPRKIIRDFFQYTLVFLPAMIASLWMLIFCWVSPFYIQSENQYKILINYYSMRMKQRGVSFTVEEQETYNWVTVE